MKESRLFIAFTRKYFVFLFFPVLLGLIISGYIYFQQSPQTKLSQSFKLEYNLENIETSLALTDQAVTELRLQNFDKYFPDSNAVIYKSGPLAITIESFSKDKTLGFQLLLKEAGYLRQNFRVSTITEPQIGLIEPNVLKYILTGLLTGFIAGLTLSLIREYLQSY